MFARLKRKKIKMKVSKKIFWPLKHKSHVNNNTLEKYCQIIKMCWHPSRFGASPSIHQLLAGLVAMARFPWAVFEPSQALIDKWGICAGANQCHPLGERDRKHFWGEADLQGALSSMLRGSKNYQVLTRLQFTGHKTCQSNGRKVGKHT